MRYLKILALVVVSLIVLFLVVAIFIPSELNIERSIEINKPISDVFPMVADLNNFNKWNARYSIEPSAYKPVVGDNYLGQVSTWSGEIVGSGSLKNVKIENNKFVEQNINLIKPFRISSKIYFHFVDMGNNTKVTWRFNTHLSYPIERIMKVKLESELSKSFNQGLANLKKICEK